MKRLSIGIAVLAALPLAALAAGTVTVSESVTVSLPSDGSNYTVTPESSFDSIDVSNGTITVVMSAGGKVVLVSGNKKNLTNSQSVATICNTNDSTVTLTGGSSGATVTITPSGSCTTSSGGGGGVAGGSFSTPGQVTGGGSSGGSPSQQVSQAPQATQAVPANPNRVQGLLKATLRSRSRGVSVTILQQMLAKDTAVYPEGLTTGFFGPATLRAVQRFQEKYDIAKKGGPGYGQVGPQTRAKLNELYGS